MVTAEISSGKGFALLASAVISNQFPLADREIVKMRCQANAAYLNELTAKATGKTVYAGPTEATAIGNLTAQIIAAGELENLQAARKCIFESFEIKKYEK